MALSEPCYEMWELKNNYPIHIIQGNRIPWQVWFDNMLIADHEEGESYFDESTRITYMTKGTAKSFPLYLPERFPADLKLKLFELREENYAPKLSFAQTREYNSGDESIQSGRELNDKQQKELHGEAVQRGKASLEEDGYDFSTATQSEIGYYRDVTSPGSDELIEVYFRSAKSGLLYLNPGLWLRLDDPNVLLVVLYADGKPRYVKSKKALLAGKFNDYILFRMMNKLQPGETDGVARQLNDDNGHLLFITDSGMQTTLSQKFDYRKTNPPINSAQSHKEDL